MSYWLQDGLTGKGLKSVFRLYLFSLLLLTPVAVLTLLSLGAERAFRLMPIPVMLLVGLQHFVARRSKRSNSLANIDVAKAPLRLTPILRVAAFGMTFLSTISLFFLGSITGLLFYRWYYSRPSPVEPSSLAPSLNSNITQLPLEGRSIRTTGDITIILDRSLPGATVKDLLDQITYELFYRALPTSLRVVTTGDRKRNFVPLVRVVMIDETLGIEPGADYEKRLTRENGDLLLKAITEAKAKYSTATTQVAESSLYRAINASSELLRLDEDGRSQEKSVYVLTDLDRADMGKSTNRINNNGINVIFIIPRGLIADTVTGKEDVQSRFTDPDRVIFLFR